MEEKKSKPALSLKQVLKTFVKSQVTISNTDRRRSVEVVQEVVEERLIKCMKKEDPLFNELYQSIYYTGSYYEGLKVNEANEFDLNIRLKLPFRKENVMVIHRGIPHGFVQYKLDRPLKQLQDCQPKWHIFNNLSRIMDDTCLFLSQDKLNRWLQSVVDKALKHNKDDFPHVKRSCHGPATTLKIELPNESPVLDIDLVPVVRLTTYPGSVRQTPPLYDIPEYKKTCFIVPKPPPENLRRQSNSDTFFRVSIPDAEKLMFENKGCVKMLIKIFKSIRDLEKWNFLCSYYIKTVFFWELEKRYQTDHWTERRLDKLFLLMLQKLFLVLSNKELPHIFFQKYNLLAVVSPHIQYNASKRIKAILKWSQKDLPKLQAYLLQANNKGMNLNTDQC